MLSIMTTTIMIIIRPTSSMSLYLVWYLKHLPKNPKTEQNEFPSRMSLGLSQKDNHRRISYLDAMRLLATLFPNIIPLTEHQRFCYGYQKCDFALCRRDDGFFFWRNKEPVEEYWRRQKNAQLVFSSYFYYCCCCQILWCGLKLGQIIQSSVCLSVAAAACQLASSLDLVLVSMQQISSTINPKMMITKHILSDQIASPVIQLANQPAIRPFHPISSRRFRQSVISRV